jgi:DNA-binding PadR family transcriptional regulator
MAAGTNSLELVVLGLLKEQDMHGYELKKRMTESLGLIMHVSWGSLYPALARLEARGAVKAVEARPAISSIPMTGSLGGERAVFRSNGEGIRGSRNKKVYGITDIGSALFYQILNDESEIDEKGFAVRLAFANHMDREKRLKMLKDRRDLILERVRSSRRNFEKKRFALEPYVELVLEHFRSTNSSDLAWIEELIRNEEAAMASPDKESLVSQEIQENL